MRVDLAADVFAGPDELCPLMDLVRCFVDRRHDWVVNDPVVPGLALGYFRREAPGLLASVELAMKGTVHAEAWTPVRGPQPPPVPVTRAGLVDLVHDLCRCAVLVVEDQQSDGHFIQTVVRVFADERLPAALANSWLEIRHAGGSGRVTEVAHQELLRFRRLPRVVVLLDSDRLVPGERTPNHDKAEGLRGVGVLVHVLELREAENYVPNRVLAFTVRGNPANQALNQVKKFSEAERGHFDFKHGFRIKDGVPVVPEGQRELYGGLDDAAIRQLVGGFGVKLLERMADHCEALTERDFEGIGVGVAEELRSLVATIRTVI